MIVLLGLEKCRSHCSSKTSDAHPILSYIMEELSPELGVADPVSGNIVSKVGYHD